jgi:putative addiction module component (TIGR02574 family)
MKSNIDDILKLSPGEKLEIIHKIWDSIDEEEQPVTDEELTIARERYEEYVKNPGDVVDWEQVKKKLFKKYGL